MRYYEFVLASSSDEIKSKSKIRLKDYDYDSTIGAVNKYLYQSMVTTIRFLAYNEEENRIIAAFSYDDSKHSFDYAYDYILNMLSDTFGIRKIKKEPYEITSYQFYEAYTEAKRRAFFHHNRLADMAKLHIHETYFPEQDAAQHFNYAEKIISTEKLSKNPLYDKSLINEFSNIEAYENNTKFSSNPVHYVISARSAEAANSITEDLMTKLYKANRLKTRRMLCINNIAPSFYKKSGYIEEMIENNCGGSVVIDLSEKFGYTPTEYNLASQYIEKLIKKYRNKCLFVFTYNMNNPGFSYGLLSQLNNYVLPVMIREGTGNRSSAVAYLKQLIKHSEYSEYANQAAKFMKNYTEDIFSQTDVLMAFEKFGAWCVNKNILNTYNYDLSADFMLDHDENEASSQEKLDNMIGLKHVKEQIKSIIANNNLEKARNKYRKTTNKASTMHMIFSGNPGTAKTTVARLFAGIARDNQLLKSGSFVEISGVELNNPLTGPCNLIEAFKSAKGGVLFIDEAYAVQSNSVITILLQELENHRDEVIVVLAGYEDKMKNFLQLNEGLKSRIPYWVDFPDYSTEELTEMFRLMLDEREYTATDDAIKEAHYIFDKARFTDDFGNGRYVRNLIEHAIKNQSLRLSKAYENPADISKKNLFMLTREDISASGENKECNTADNERESNNPMMKLDKMIGLSSVKSVIKKVVASAKINKYCMEKGIRKDRASLHMVFTGNPGTAKTTVARLFGIIMNDESLLPTGNFIEAGRADLVGKYVGHTAVKVRQLFKKARGGILFIDEAYSLCDSDKGSFGDEAINTIVQEMENHREDTVVIFAGYPDEMGLFLNKNPGLSSRIAFRVKFDDYSTEELCEITKLMVAEKDMVITDEALTKLKSNYDIARKSNDYGNGRYVRKLLEEAEMNLAQRISEMNESEISTELLTTIEECDIPECISHKKNANKNHLNLPIGFKVS